MCRRSASVGFSAVTLFLLHSLLLLLCRQQVMAEFYSSIHEMSKLVQYESVLVDHMQKFTMDNEKKLEFLKARLSEFEQEHNEMLEEGAEYLQSPVNKYLLTKRLSMDWERVENLMNKRAGHVWLERLENHKQRHQWPDANELNGAIAGLLRIQDIYQLHTKDIAAGVFNNISYGGEMGTRHCRDMGAYALQNAKPLLGHSWLLEALSRLDAEKAHEQEELSTEEPTEWDINFLLADAKHKLGDIEGANRTYAALIEQQPGNEQLAKAYEEFLQDSVGKISVQIDYSKEHPPIPTDPTILDQESLYKYTCSGHFKQSPSAERDLRCGYLTETHPFLTIAPIKVEELNHDPLLVLYYDVISDNEIAVVKNLTTDKIQRATVMGKDAPIISPVRTSQFVFIPQTRHKVLQIIDQRVSDMTNLHMHGDHAEDHQFANYGIGGHYGQHHDYFEMSVMDENTLADSRLRGNRIGTVLFYLSDVEQGGGTAFPYMMRLVNARKGAAAFWHNLHASGDGDTRTLHGACPIIVGSKWVQNRWIRERGQDDRRPCELYNDKL